MILMGLIKKSLMIMMDGWILKRTIVGYREKIGLVFFQGLQRSDLVNLPYSIDQTALNF